MSATGKDGHTEFLSTPSARRATSYAISHTGADKISIHALREEGDTSWELIGMPGQDFYPRPPRGGRPMCLTIKATDAIISIHALREEGDHGFDICAVESKVFLSTPSARRATPPDAQNKKPALISIHALREEGDDALAD